MRLKRVTVTVPVDVLKAADTQARRLGRSRSWVVSEALRTYATTSATIRPAQASESSRAPYASALDDARAALREADLRLTPAERLQAAEELADDAAALRPRPRIRQVLQFDRLEDWFAWKKRDLLW